MSMFIPRTWLATLGLLLHTVTMNAAPSELGGNPTNDDCAGAIELISGATCVPVNGDVAGATQSLPAITCSGITGTADDDVWYWFTATNTSQMIEVVGSSGFNAVIDLRTGACNGTNYRCTDLAIAGGTEILTATNLTVGTIYYVRIYSRDATVPSTTSFTICVHDPITPTNDDCGSAIELVPNPICSPVTGTVAFATQSIPAITCNGFTGNANDDVWYKFTATETTHTIEVVLGAGWDGVLDLRSGSCNGTNIACSDSPTMVATGLTVGETYYLRIYHYFSAAPTNTSFTVCLVGEAPSSCPASSGTLTADASPVCLVAGSADISATPDGNAVVPTGYETVYVLTQGAGLVIVQAGATPNFTVAIADDYTIHTLVYDPTTLDLSGVVLGTTTGFDVNALLIQGGGSICASLDVAGAPITVEECVVCDANAGALIADATPVCLVAGSATISATPDGNAVVPTGYETLFVLTQGPGLVIIGTSTTPSFDVALADSYTIHTLVYDPTTLDLSGVVLGTTTGFDVNALLIQGGGSICASMDVAGAPITVEECVVCDANAGALIADATPVCLVAGSADISATPDGNAVVPVGYETVYVLTQGAGLVIVNAGATPIFNVTSADDYTIHTLVYDPLTLDPSGIVLGVTTGFDVNALLIQGGGSICASLDVAGAPITVQECVVCDANAGALIADATPVCLVAGSADISATPDGNAVVPTGYETVYVLTQGAGLVIVQAGATPNFTVTIADDYTIHTLVYDPTTLDLSGVVLGTTTGFDVNALLIQGGGSICASLDVAGAPITVEECVVCDANAGALIADATPVCLIAGSATISATPDGNAVVPTGYETLFVLTQGPGLVIIGTSTTPSFDVALADSYTIHTLVYDPTTLDLSGVVLGTTTGFDVNALLIQGGGSICASLDVVGALIEVSECVVCDADAGTLTADETPVCLFGGSAQVGATPNGDAVVPVGYETAFVLTQGPGLVIIDLGVGPVFTVNAPGSYTIHTLVYDPLTIDPSLIELGVTTGFDVNGLLIQGGGTICGALDVLGAPISVNDCAPGNNDCVNAFPIGINVVDDCPAAATAGDNTYATMDGGDATCDDPGSDLLDVWYTFNAGPNTSVTINFDQGTMEDWAIVISDGCNGNELACVIQPVTPIDFTTVPDTDYLVRVYSNATFGNGGQFSLCITGDTPTVVCDGGSVQTSTGAFSVDVCQDVDADIIDFNTTSTSAENYVFLLTDESNVIIAQLMGGSLDFNSAGLGVYRVWGISYNGTLVGADPGSLATEITSTGTCVDLSDNYVLVNVDICDGITDMTVASWNLFPNPGNGDFSLTYAGPDAITTLDVVDMEGRVVYQERQSMSTGQVVPFALHGQLAMGVYNVRLNSEAGSANLRLVVR
ncbi:MAG: T9SS type A sorting domain-containing protein [Flavobacteriales bacterium]|nr:T9SS type A sorting domain-containing protein [Flavobacteriales bacterium]